MKLVAFVPLELVKNLGVPAYRELTLHKPVFIEKNNASIVHAEIIVQIQETIQ